MRAAYGPTGLLTPGDARPARQAGTLRGVVSRRVRHAEIRFNRPYVAIAYHDSARQGPYAPPARTSSPWDRVPVCSVWVGTASIR